MDNDDNEGVLYASVVEATKTHILGNTATNADNLSSVLNKHEMFREVSEQARKMASVRGAALSAASCMLSFLFSTDNSSPELQVLRLVSQMYIDLYRRHCTITFTAWRTSVQECFRSSSQTLHSMLNLGANTAEDRPDSIATPYFEMIKATHSSAKCDGSLALGEDELTDDDGSFAETQLRLFLKRCLQIGRKNVSRARAAKGSKAETFQKVWKEMLNAMQLCANEMSLDW